MFAETYFGFLLEHQSGSSKTCVTIPFGSIALNAEVASIFGDPATKTRPNHWEYEWTLDAKYAERHVDSVFLQRSGRDCRVGVARLPTLADEVGEAAIWAWVRRCNGGGCAGVVRGDVGRGWHGGCLMGLERWRR